MAGFEESMPPPLQARIAPQLVAPVLACALLQTFSQAILFVQLSTYLSSPRVSRPTASNRESRWKVAYTLLVSTLAA